MSLELILVASLVLVFNVLDSISTHLCFSLPSNLGGKEANPIMASLMGGDYLIAEIVKHLGVTLLVVYWVYVKNMGSLLVVAILFGLVVLNNSYIFGASKIAKKKPLTVFSVLMKVIHKVSKVQSIPNWLEFLLIVAILLGVSKWLSYIILGVIK